MKLFTANAPSPLRVSLFLAEKGIELDSVWLDVLAGQTRGADHLARNNLGEVPVLELDDGTYLTESLAICRHLEREHPHRPLMGTSPLKVAKIDMWSQRMDQQICAPVGDFARHSFAYFADKLDQIPAYANTRLAQQDDRWAWLDEVLSDGRTYVVDDTLSFTDMVGASALMVSSIIDHPVPNELKHTKRWERAVRSLKGW